MCQTVNVTVHQINYRFVRTREFLACATPFLSNCWPFPLDNYLVLIFKKGGLLRLVFLAKVVTQGRDQRGNRPLCSRSEWKDCQAAFSAARIDLYLNWRHTIVVFFFSGQNYIFPLEMGWSFCEYFDEQVV